MRPFSDRLPGGRVYRKGNQQGNLWLRVLKAMKKKADVAGRGVSKTS